MVKCDKVFGEDGFYVKCELDEGHHMPHVAHISADRRDSDDTLCLMDGLLSWTEQYETTSS